MSDTPPVVIITRRPGDPTEPTIGDGVCGDLAFVNLERPRTPLPEDFIDGAAHPCIDPIDTDLRWTENEHPEHPFIYEIMHVEGRTAILFHSADVIMQLEGCLAPGKIAVTWKKDAIRPGVPAHDTRGVASSLPMLEMIQDKLCRKNTRIIIQEGVST